MYFLAGKSSSVPSQEQRLWKAEFLWLSPPRISHRSNISFLTVTAVLLLWLLFGMFCFVVHF